MIYVLTKNNKKATHNINYIKVLNKNILPTELSDFINANSKKNKSDFESFKTSLNKKEYLDKTFTFVNNENDSVLEKIKTKQILNLMIMQLGLG